MTATQAIAIILSTVGGIAMLLAMTKPDFDRLFTDWRLRTGTGVLGLMILLAGIGGAFYFQEKPKTLVESGREVLDKGSDAARDGVRRVKEALPRPSSWWPWSEKPAEREKK